MNTSTPTRHSFRAGCTLIDTTLPLPSDHVYFNVSACICPRVFTLGEVWPGCFVVDPRRACGMVKTDPPKLSEIQVGHPAPATRAAAYRATDERRLRQSASSPGLPAVPHLQARPTAPTSPVNRRGFETRARTPDGGGGLIVAIRPPSQPPMRSPPPKPLRSPPSQPTLQRPAWYPAELSAVAGGGAAAPSVPTRPATSHEARAHRSPQQGLLTSEHAPAPLRRPQSVHGTRGGGGGGGGGGD